MILREIFSALLGLGKYKDSPEEIVSIWNDTLSILPIVFIILQILLHPNNAQKIASYAIEKYALSEHAAMLLRAYTR